PATPRGGMIVSAHSVDRAGHVLGSTGEVRDRVLPRLCAFDPRGRPSDVQLASCARRLGVHDVLTVHPASQVWPLQVWETAIFLVMGLATQRLAWSDEFCEELATAGRFVVRFDNRDAGESTHFHDFGEPGVVDLLARRPHPYRIDDMADDVVGLLDALDLEVV